MTCQQLRSSFAFAISGSVLPHRCDRRKSKTLTEYHYMRRTAFAVVAVIALAACQQMTTEPAAAPDLSIRSLVSNPPPPPIDSGSVGYSEGTNTTFNLRVTYFFNKTANSGWLKFDSEMGDASVDKNAQVRFSSGQFSGKGTITIGDVSIDLTKVSQTSQFGSCESWGSIIGPDIPTSTTDSAPVGCFNLVIGDTAGSRILLTEKCPTIKDAYDPRAVCKSRIITTTGE